MINLDAITIEDCIEMYVMKGMHAIIISGKVVGFKKEDK